MITLNDDQVKSLIALLNQAGNVLMDDGDRACVYCNRCSIDVERAEHFENCEILKMIKVLESK